MCSGRVKDGFMYRYFMIGMFSNADGNKFAKKYER